MKNPLLDTEHFLQFDKIKPKDISPAIDTLLSQNRKLLKMLLKQRHYSWDNLIQPLEDANNKLHTAWSIASHLHSVVDTPSLRKTYELNLQKVTIYFTEIAQNRSLYNAIEKIATHSEFNMFDQAQKTIIKHMLRDFKLAGVALPATKRRKFAQLEQQSSQLSNKFANNVLDATYGYQKHITSKNQLAGLPAHTVAAAKHAATQKQQKGWLFSLDHPTFIAIMTHADNRELRSEMHKAFATRASELGLKPKQWNNSPILQQIMQTRFKISKLLKYKNYADYSIAPKMAKSTRQVLTFLNKLANHSKDKARDEFSALQQFAREHLNIAELQPWDIAYSSEKLRQHKFSISQEELRPYFPLTQVLPGLFNLSSKLFGIQIKQSTKHSTWHKDVLAYEIYDSAKQLVAVFYLDLYARPHKHAGAWMHDARSRHIFADKQLQLPIAFINCNFLPPLKKQPALLTHNDVETLFHEFGHALQHMLTTVNYSGASGINGIPWDAVELPSQFMEYWCWQKPVINMISKHYKTGKKLPQSMFNRMLKAKNFQSGLQMLRQIEFALYDFRLHLEFNPKLHNQTQTILDTVRAKISVLPHAAYDRFQNSFAHIFAGGYAAGYYSYKWAEVLAADAFAKFEEEGLFNKKIGQAFLHCFLQPGGSVDPATLFKKFRGRSPNITALLRQSGIAKESNP